MDLWEDHRLRELEGRVWFLFQRVEKIMTDVSTIQSELQTDDNMLDVVAKHQSDMDAEIASLKAQVAAGQPVDLSGLEAIQADMNSKLVALTQQQALANANADPSIAGQAQSQTASNG